MCPVKNLVCTRVGTCIGVSLPYLKGLPLEHGPCLVQKRLEEKNVTLKVVKGWKVEVQKGEEMVI